jgi:hypothetical protein
MYLEDEHNVMRHVSYQRLLKNEDGDPVGEFLPEAFELKEDENGLSVNWLECFGGDMSSNIKESIDVFRRTRRIGKSSAYGVASVGVIQKICTEFGFVKVRVLHDPEDDNESHTLIIRLPTFDNIKLYQSLAKNAFGECIYEKDFP